MVVREATFCFVPVVDFVGASSRVGALLGQPPRHVLVGGLDLGVGGAGVGEFVARVGVLQVSPHARHVRRNVVVAVLLRDNLAEKAKQSDALNGRLDIRILRSGHRAMALHNNGSSPPDKDKLPKKTNSVLCFFQKPIWELWMETSL